MQFVNAVNIMKSSPYARIRRATWPPTACVYKDLWHPDQTLMFHDCENEEDHISRSSKCSGTEDEPFGCTVDHAIASDWEKAEMEQVGARRGVGTYTFDFASAFGKMLRMILAEHHGPPHGPPQVAARRSAWRADDGLFSFVFFDSCCRSYVQYVDGTKSHSYGSSARGYRRV